MNFILDIPYDFIPYAFWESDIADWDHMYVELKCFLLPALLEGKWDFFFGETWLEEYIFMITIEFNEKQKLKDFVITGRFEEDKRKTFDVIEIYLSNQDMTRAYSIGLIKDTEKHKWLLV